jgi:3-hydroxybutyryl-CoA dehydratase
VSPGWRRFPEITHTIGRAEIDRYAEISGDFNPLHMDAEFAAGTPFKTNIAHGPIGLQTVFEAVAEWVGGDGVPPGVRVDVSYRGPVHIDDAVTCRAVGLADHAGDLMVSVVASNQRGEEVVQAIVLVPRHLAARAP